MDTISGTKLPIHSDSKSITSTVSVVTPQQRDSTLPLQAKIQNTRKKLFLVKENGRR